MWWETELFEMEIQGCSPVTDTSRNKAPGAEGNYPDWLSAGRVDLPDGEEEEEEASTDGTLHRT